MLYIHLINFLCLSNLLGVSGILFRSGFVFGSKSLVTPEVKASPRLVGKSSENAVFDDDFFLWGFLRWLFQVSLYDYGDCSVLLGVVRNYLRVSWGAPLSCMADCLAPEGFERQTEGKIRVGKTELPKLVESFVHIWRWNNSKLYERCQSLIEAATPCRMLGHNI